MGSASPAAILSLLTDNMENTNGDANGKQEFDTLELRNRTVTETLSEVKDFGQNQKEEDKNGSSKDDKNGNDAEAEADKFDKLELRNRTVTETLSLVSDFGKNQKNDDNDEPEAKKKKFD